MASAILTAVEKSAFRSCRTRCRLVGETRLHLALDDGAVGHAAGRRHALRERFGIALGGEAGDGHRALRDGVDLAVRGLHRRHDQRAAGERGGVAERGDADVDARAGLDEGRQIGGDDDGRDVLGARAAAFAGDAEIFQHGADRLLGERRIAQAVAGPLQPDDQAVADQLVVARALQLRDVLDARDRAALRRQMAARGRRTARSRRRRLPRRSERRPAAAETRHCPADIRRPRRQPARETEPSASAMQSNRKGSRIMLRRP